MINIKNSKILNYMANGGGVFMRNTKISKILNYITISVCSFTIILGTYSQTLTTFYATLAVIAILGASYSLYLGSVVNFLNTRIKD